MSAQKWRLSAAELAAARRCALACGSPSLAGSSLQQSTSAQVRPAAYELVGRAAVCCRVVAWCLQQSGSGEARCRELGGPSSHPQSPACCLSGLPEALAQLPGKQAPVQQGHVWAREGLVAAPQAGREVGQQALGP